MIQTIEHRTHNYHDPDTRTQNTNTIMTQILEHRKHNYHDPDTGT